jgi:signal transduction histidine kinase
MSRRFLRVALLFGLPLALLLAGEIAARRALVRDADAARRDMEARADGLESLFRQALDAASTTARTALERSPRAAWEAGQSAPLTGRLEGTGLLDASSTYTSWEGRPDHVRPAAAGSGPTWEIQVEGLSRRLVVASARDAAGRAGVATYLLDSPQQGFRFDALLPRSLTAGPLRSVEFLDIDEPRTDSSGTIGDDRRLFRPGPPAALYVPLRSPGGDVLALATLEEIPPAHRAAERRSSAAAAAATLFCLMLVGLFDWRRVASWRGFVLVLAAVAAGRTALLLSRVTVQFLPREIGSASLFGSALGFGLLGSPADFLLTCLAGFLAALALAAALRTSASRRPRTAAAVAAAAAVVLVILVGTLSADLARDTRVPLLHLDAPPLSPGAALLLLGLSLAILGAAELLALPWSVLGRPRASRPNEASRRAVAIAALPIVAVASVVLLSTADRAARERLRSEFAPQVVEQSPRRHVALLAAVREAAQSEGATEAVSEPTSPRDEYAAYLVWVGGDLFHAGYKSSLDFYDAAGRRRSHFGFDLPKLSENAPSADGPLAVAVRDETSPLGALRHRVLHAEAPILDEKGVRIGTVVGHVLDEPDNLPFLPASETFLSALGPGAPRTAAGELASHPDYILYGADGTVLLSTLDQPPAADGGLREAARGHGTAGVEVAGQPYIALPLAAADRLHVLLLPELTWLDQLGALVRLAILSLLLLGILSAARSLSRGGGIPDLLGGVRASFYRKLLAVLLAASILPLLGLAFFVRGTIERQAEAGFVESTAHLARIVSRVVEDWVAVEGERAGGSTGINDEILQWLRQVVGQDIHLYENGALVATSRRELFASGYLIPRLPGEIDRRVVRGGLPFLLRRSSMSASPIPTVYTRVHLPGPDRGTVVAVPAVLQQQGVTRSVARIAELVLLATVALAGLLAAAAALIAGTVSRPVRDLVGATSRIAAGHYDTRIRARTRDEVAGLVERFNTMAAALAAQRADLLARKDYIEALLSHATTGVVSTDAEGRIVTLNPAAVTLLAPAGTPPRSGDALVAAVRREPDLAPLAAALSTPSPGSGEPREVDLVRAAKPLRLRLVRVDLPDPSGGPPGSLVLLDDVTDMMRSNQLEAWAEMARAIAHEIKNPLTPIQLSTEHLTRLLRDRLAQPSPEIEACIENVTKQVRALREIAAEFSTYAKLPTLRTEPTDPVAFLREIAATYRSGPPPGVAVEERYEPTPPIAADRRVLGRAIVNLVENALQAMPEGGTLTFAARPSPGGGTILTVADTGTGLDPSVQRHLFQPYFSTKSSGTGLGLAIVRRAVEAHGGSIDVESSQGEGTAFHIRLPAAG